MNNIILSAPVADQSGSIEFRFNPSKTELFSMSRRVNRRATLDGSAVIEDYGFSEADRTLKIVARLQGVSLTTLNYMIKTFSSVIVSTVDGIFLASFQDTRVKGSEVTLTILIKEKLA